MTASETRPTDVEIMMFLDGELEGEPAETVARFLETSSEGADVAASIGQVSELVRGSVELEADAAEDRLSGLWAGIEKALDSNGVSKEAPSVAPVISIQAKAEEKATEKLVEKASWFGGWQSHIAIGAFAAAAAVLLMYSQKGDAPEQAVANQQEQVAGQPLQPKIVPVALRSQEPEVEELEVYDGSGVIMTVPAEAESDEGASAVIWISSDTDVVEDPI